MSKTLSKVKDNVDVIHIMPTELPRPQVGRQLTQSYGGFCKREGYFMVNWTTRLQFLYVNHIP